MSAVPKPESAVVVRRDSAPVPVHTFADLERMAAAVAASKLFGVQTKEAALSLMLLAQAEGRHPAIAARDYHIIEGRPALKADAMLARFMEAGGRVDWHEISDLKVSATFSNPDGGHFRVEWTMETARQAGLAERSPWKKYPRAMLRSRVVSEGVRTIMPGVIVGTYTPEELRDGDVEIRDVTPRGEQPAPAAAADPSVIEGEVIRPAAEAPAPTDKPRLSEGAIADHLAAISGAADDVELRKVFGCAYNAAWSAEDFESLKQFDAAKRAVKDRLAGVTP